MSARYMLDINICIYLRQNRPPEVTTRFRHMQHGDAVTSVITYGELHYGAERSQQRTHALESLRRLVSGSLAGGSGDSLRRDSRSVGDPR